MNESQKIKMTHEEWKTKGEELYGPDIDKWAFVCPVCSHVATVADFRACKEKGAIPDSATCECIGRYREGSRSAFNAVGRGPCTYAGFGLFKLSPVCVTIDGKEKDCFAFAVTANDRTGE